MLLGALVALISQFPHHQIITIGIETGMQNFGVAFLIILFSLPSPEKDYAVLPLMSVALLTPLPFYLVVAFNAIKKLILKIKSKFGKSNKEKEQIALEEGTEMLPIENKA